MVWWFAGWKKETWAATTASGICSSPPPKAIAASTMTGVKPADTAPTAAALLDLSHRAGAGGRRRTVRVMLWADAADPALGKTLET